MQTQIDGLRADASDDRVFANMYQSIAQAQERQLEYTEEHLQEEIDAMSGADEGGE